jgi:hypothetical protein
VISIFDHVDIESCPMTNEITRYTGICRSGCWHIESPVDFRDGGFCSMSICRTSNSFLDIATQILPKVQLRLGHPRVPVKLLV